MATIREVERGVWLDESVPDEFRRDVEMLCHLLSDCVSDLVISLSLFEQAQAANRQRVHPKSAFDRDQWQREGQRRREREAELEAAAGVSPGDPHYWEKSEQVRERVRRELLHEKWQREGGPETYAHRTPFIHARSFISTLAVLQRALIALCKYEFAPEVRTNLEAAAQSFAEALPGLKDVRDSTAHVEDRVRGRRFDQKIEPQPVSNPMVHAPGGGVMVIESLNNQHFGGTIADGTFAEVEVADPTTEVARVAVQAVFDALPWRPGPRSYEPSS